MAMSVASVLAGMRGELKGNVKFAFQPAEETAGGALGMIESGALEDPKVDAALALHIINGLEAGRVGVRVGGMFASVDEFTIKIQGTGGHAAHPESLVDPVLVAGQAVNALHQIVGRNVGALEAAVLSIGMIRGGTAFNIIPDEVELKGTVRAFDDGTRDRVMGRIEEVLSGITAAAGASYAFEDIYQSPVVMNEPAMTALVRSAATRAIGAENVIDCEPSMGGDDMAYFQKEVPGCYFIVGGGDEEGEYGPHHSGTFGFDERALEVGLKVMTESALEYLGRG